MSIFSSVLPRFGRSPDLPVGEHKTQVENRKDAIRTALTCVMNSPFYEGDILDAQLQGEILNHCVENNPFLEDISDTPEEERYIGLKRRLLNGGIESMKDLEDFVVLDLQYRISLLFLEFNLDQIRSAMKVPVPLLPLNNANVEVKISWLVEFYVKFKQQPWFAFQAAVESAPYEFYENPNVPPNIYRIIRYI